MTKFNVFTKVKTKGDGKTFNVRLTKNEAGVTFEVRFTQDCENSRVLPKDSRPFVLVVDNKSISMTKKKVYDAKSNKDYIKYILYVRAIEDIEEYVEPEFDVDAFNAVGTDEELPF